ncbi:MAG: DUF3383 family protein [Alphaproteobacteria bacterium]|nr:DUF3383 family protein [Alphaproteobacteria bacterium]
MSTIPASQIVNVQPNVLSAGGSALEILGLLLTTSDRPPIGAVLSFATAADVSSYFGPSSDEYAASQIYFNGFDNSNLKPGAVLFAQYNADDVAGWLRGGSLATMTLTELKALAAGTISLTVGGDVETSASIDLSAAISFSNAATIIEAAFTTPPFGVTWDSVASAFVFTTTATGAAATITYAATAALATSLKLTSATGAVISQGADATDPGTFMDGIVLTTQNWATFCTLFDPDDDDTVNKLAFAEWTSNQNNRYAYMAWDSDTAPAITVPATASLGYLVSQAEYSGTSVISSPDYSLAVFGCAIQASIDFAEQDGRTTSAFRSQSGLTPSATDATAAANLIANGYNFYGVYATAADEFNFFYPGSISGDFAWIDSYINQIQFNNALQLSLMTLLTTQKSIPYNAGGYALIKAACLDPINDALNFGTIRTGVTLSASQKAQITAAAGVDVSAVLETDGWYLQVSNPSATVRQERGSPPTKLWYMDGESVQQIDLTSILVQ